MCVKSKTSYGCGHRIKVTEPCGSVDCTTIDRWKFPTNKDCPQCKSGGEAITRGKEGRGRHGREILIRESRQSSSDSYGPPSPSSTGSPHLSISPWACSNRSSNEKKWDTPTRQMADAAWLVEHERRMSDLEETTSKMSLRPQDNPYSTSRTHSARSSYERVIEADEVEEPEDMDDIPPPRTKAMKMLPYEIAPDSDHSPSRHRSRKPTNDAQRNPPRRADTMPRTPHRQIHFDHVTQEYLEEPSPQQPIHKSRRSKTEPQYPQACCFDPPVTILPSSPMVGGHWIDHFEITQPLQHTTYYPKTHQVY